MWGRATATDGWNSGAKCYLLNVRKLPIIFVVTVSIGFGTFVFGQELTPAEKQARVQQAMPAPLPQSPAVATAKSDASDLRLRGHVKEVIESHGSEGSLQQVSDQVFDK